MRQLVLQAPAQERDAGRAGEGDQGERKRERVCVKWGGERFALGKRAALKRKEGKITVDQHQIGHRDTYS